ncbi:unnamed protein product [Adineta ricciae]|uniref:NAD(P)(+)--arginine ADP-ribosyltransferase n=1 Tax=Adineta ricciae TaxID=249248 RepID=A0A814UJ47_ADIRI|nr:unnamed protein product [Adineta ricciae]CAF1174212.1 unnamed protein product [Adineta ricciae]
MTHSTTGLSNSNDERQEYCRLSRFFQQYFRPLPSKPPLLYLACLMNDVARVKSCLETVEYEEINYQHLPNNDTALHVATRNQHKEIIQMLLFHGARRSLSNIDSQQAYELAGTKEIKDLFQRPSSNRFVFALEPGSTVSEDQWKVKCKVCSLVDDTTLYEWELIDQDAAEKSLRFRHELKSLTPMDEKDLKRKLHTIEKGYINTRLHDILSENMTKVHNYLQCALRKQDPDYIIAAYTISQKFSKLLNEDMARNIIHDLKNGCSQFSCDCLYSTEDGTRAIISILLRYERYQKRSFVGRSYRGIVLPRNVLDHYKVGSCIMTTTFLSTSANRYVAEMFSDKGTTDPNKQSYFCIYEIINNDQSTAIDISGISEFQN